MKRKKGESLISYHARLDRRDFMIAMGYMIFVLLLCFVGLGLAIF